MIDNSIFKTGSVMIASHRQPDSAFSIAAPLSLFLFYSSLVISSQCLPWWMPSTQQTTPTITNNVMSI